MEDDTIIMTEEERKKSLEEARKAIEQSEAKDEADGSESDPD